ncbi:MAG: rRNA maturation RNase YbeY [Rickettsiales bacterium]|jgi:probable rRNA maturation factor|nr:rRNA maturation RNase YbeY [Rickettsiales bacterium]
MVKFNLEYCVKEKKWLSFIEEATISRDVGRLLEETLSELNVETDAIIELSITFTNDSRIQKINKKFRQKDTPTNVLSFPLYEKEFFNISKKESYIALGDIVLSLETIIAEANELGITFKSHLNHLIIHSILHLLGFDHKNKLEEKNMERLEKTILDILNRPF